MTHISPVQLLEILPEPNYAAHYQPVYPDGDALLDAIHELHVTEAVTTPRQVDALQGELTKLAEGHIDRPIIVEGGCAEEVDLSTSIEKLVGLAVAEHELVLAALPKAIHIRRDRGQTTKPRSAEKEQLPDGSMVESYMGDAVNAKGTGRRTPDPSRMVASAVQARDIEQGLTEALGGHLPAAHEALLLPYEHSFIRVDPETGKKYLLSTDMPWIGKRTNAIDGEHVALLAEVENPIGIKIGPDSTAEHIAALAQKLNPNGIPGKLTFMVRVGPKNAEALTTVMQAIKDHAPNAIIMYDIHGVTRTAPTGEKIRYTGDIIADIKGTAMACRAVGLTLHGLHLETTPDSTRLECVDEPDQLPTHPGNVDPQLNPRQTDYVIRQTAKYLL